MTIAVRMQVYEAGQDSANLPVVSSPEHFQPKWQQMSVYCRLVAWLLFVLTKNNLPTATRNTPQRPVAARRAPAAIPAPVVGQSAGLAFLLWGFGGFVETIHERCAGLP